MADTSFKDTIFTEQFRTTASIFRIFFREAEVAATATNTRVIKFDACVRLEGTKDGMCKLTYVSILCHASRTFLD